MFGRILRLFLISSLVWGFFFSGILLGQEAAPQQQPQQTAPTVTISRSYWFEILLVVLLFGAALWAICKPSRRN